MELQTHEETCELCDLSVTPLWQEFTELQNKVHELSIGTWNPCIIQGKTSISVAKRMAQCSKWKRKYMHSKELLNICEKPWLKWSGNWSLISQHMLLFHWSSHCNFTSAFVTSEAAVWLFFLYSFANLFSFWVISPSLWHLHPAAPQSHKEE